MNVQNNFNRAPIKFRNIFSYPYFFNLFQYLMRIRFGHATCLSELIHRTKMHDSATRKFNLMRQISGTFLSPEYGTYFGAIKRRCWNCDSNLVFSMTKKRVRFRDSKTALEISFSFIFFCFRCFLLKKLRLRMCDRQILRMHMTNENTMTKNIQLPEFKICNGNKLYFF